MIFMASRDAFHSFTFISKNIPVVVAVMIISSLIESSMFFFQSKLLVLLYIFLKHMPLFWRLILFFIDSFFICSLGSVIYKKYANANGKDSKYTNVIDISITCGGVGSAVGRGGGSVGDAVVSLLALLASFFRSFKILSFNLFI